MATTTTVFVRFIPPSVNIRRHHLENVFSQIGPIKKSSVILPHNNHNNKKKKPLSPLQDAEDTTTTATAATAATATATATATAAAAAAAASSYGFVKYTTELDAQRAAQKLNHSSLKVSDTETVKLKVERASRTTTAAAVPAASSKKDGRDKEKSRRQQHHPSREVDHHHNDNENDVDDDHEDHSLKKTNRLIVRNLSFYAKKSHIQKALESQFGPLVDIHIPSVVVTKKSPATSSSTTDKAAAAAAGVTTRTTTTHRGFCFVTFQHAQHAQECLAHVEQEGKEVLIAKRPVSIARALNKTAFEHQQQHQKQHQKQHHHPGGGTKQKSSSSSNVVIPEQEKPTAAQKEHDEDSSNDSDDSSSSDSGSSDSGSSDSDDDDDDDDGKDMKGPDDSESDGDDESAPTSDDDNDEKKTNNSGNNDRAAVEEKRTLFLRNLPFDATRHDLFELFYKFGYITGIYLVKDKETGIPKGTAFVSFRDAKGIQRALRAAASSESNVVVNNDGQQEQQQPDSSFVRQRDNDGGGGGGGLMLKGRRIFVNLAVDKETAFSLTMDQKSNPSAADGGTSTTATAGEANSTKDRRNLYLKGEGRVDNQTDEDGNENNAWDELPESDKLKRQRAWSDKNSKLRSPLFFINPTRLSVRNLAKDVTEVELKRLCVEALQHGLENKLVTAQDQIAHWKASGDVSTRDILKRVEALPDEEDVIPAFDAQNVRKFIPSVFIDCDFSTKNKKDKVSRGFGFVEFEHHAHALACLRELNNNTRYTQEYATGGKHAVITRMRQRKSSGGKKGKNRHNNNNKTNGDGSNDNQVKLPRLIVEFAVENISKAKQQAEHRALQQANMIKQKREHRESTETSTKKEKKKSRGQRQREKKRRRKEAGEDNGDEGVHENATPKANERRARAANVSQQQQQHANRGETIKVKKVKPPKRRKVDKDEEEFQKLVASYKSSFAPDLSSNTTANDGDSRPKAKKRWFE